MIGSILLTFFSAFQAALSVLLIVVYGVIAAHFKLLTLDASKSASQLCVNLFLPALLMTNVGDQLSLESGARYVPLLVWSLVYNFGSIGLGVVCTRIFKLPGWVTPAITFNNTTSLPLLLVQSLGTTDVLNRLLRSPDDTKALAIARANSYFLINAMVGDALTFGLGPKLLGCHSEESEHSHGHVDLDTAHNHNGPVEARDGDNGRRQANVAQEEREAHPTEETSLLSNALIRKGLEWKYQTHVRTQLWWANLPDWLRSSLDFGYQFVNAPMIGAIIGAVIGLVPFLHVAFFNEESQGGIFNAWLTTSIRNIGNLFPALQVIVVGVKLHQSLLAMKNGEEGGRVGWRPALFVLFVRFILWSLLGISAIFVLAKYTTLLTDDAMLWFCMMIMAIGPSAMKLTAMADVSGADEDEKMAIAKFLTISYALSPIMAFFVVGSLYACEAAI